MPRWRNITAQVYVENSDPDGFDEARIECPDGWWREIWDASIDDINSCVVVTTSLAEPVVVALDATIRVR